MTRFERLDARETTLVLAIESAGAPRLLYWGEPLAPTADLAGLEAALHEGRRASVPDRRVPPTIFPVAGFGWMGMAALSGVRPGGDDAIDWSECAVARRANDLEITLRDYRQGLRVQLQWQLDPETGVLAARTRLTNDGVVPFSVHAVAALSLPLPPWAREILSFSGDWAREAEPQRFAAPVGRWSVVNRTGRTGFAGATLLALAPDAGDAAGRALLFHLGWSGSHVLSIETCASGERLAQLEALLGPGEIEIAPGSHHDTPTAYACFSSCGLNGISDRFHPFVRSRILPAPARGPRRVHFNSWEGVYFDFDAARLKLLAEGAAALGAERFVLDDGWFTGRRNDRAGLGDWEVDRTLFPDGLGPLISHVHALGMEFGLWVEPEMVNPDSALYRRHPDWCVHAPGAERPTMRHQLWLDLAREEVRDYLFASLDALLRAHPITYLKWDCNRFLFPSASKGRPSGQAIVTGVYQLLDRLRERHPALEIESCASGGGRIDLEILKRTTRVWASDTTDAVERLRIQRWGNLVLPLEIIGAHVGPSPNPITGRRLSMDFRAKIALFGHMGVELDPGRLSEHDSDTLRAHLALYKAHRALLHSGRVHAWMSDDGADCRIVTALDGSEAIALIARGAAAARMSEAAPVRFPALDGGGRYVVRLLRPWPRLATWRLADAALWEDGRVFDGSVLARSGMRLALSEPETAWLVHFRRQ